MDKHVIYFYAKLFDFMWWNLVDIWIFLRSKSDLLHLVSWVTCPKCNILIGLSCAVVYIYMMQAKCFCWLCCFVHFLTNSCELFITNSAHVFKKTVFLSDFGICYYVLALFICYFTQRKPASIESQWSY